ncbi:hypothetical protein BO71DRAFT_398594 [Aspergillus ellipticus CBS 707.79]|uniref:Uncharacterized protein n=1 Tax=Aspergillus ellipticus CBS 707.79 TaxID=1448320 RepID=A0A319DBG3_9EURO|nr:hypothetical protein BO71DRAFT_398594 [Aspergillus ellipticus CBS 707.79]
MHATGMTTLHLALIPELAYLLTQPGPAHQLRGQSKTTPPSEAIMHPLLKTTAIFMAWP